MATTEERLAALEAKMAQLTDTTPTTYYTHQYSGEEIDNAVSRALPNGAIDQAAGTFVRPNLLDNWYFGRPVNQRGKTEYTGNGYTVDRWKLDIDIGTVTVESDGIVLDGGSTGCTLYELQEPALLSMLEGQILTFSAMYTILSQTESPGGFGTTISGAYVARCIFGGSVGVKNVASGSAVMPTNLQSVSWFYVPAGCKIKIHAVKVELGSTQTLAHREGDKWILNEVPDYGEQLRRCQRYCRVYKAGEYLPCLAYAESDGWYLSASMYIGNMRTTPIHNLGSGLSCSVSNIDGGTSMDKTIMNWGTVGSTIQRLRISGGDKTPGPFPYNVMPKQDLIFSADL